MLSRIPQSPRALLQFLSRSIPGILGRNVVGLYVYGSLVTGGYDDGVSDVDFLAVTTEDLDDIALERLRVMHAEIEQEHPRWKSRVEVAYLSRDGLRSFRTRTSPMINISPGEPIHRIQAGADWAMNWYQVRTAGVTLLGPPPHQVIPQISKEDFVRAVADHARNSSAWSERSPDRKSQSYAILTLCRALHTLDTGEQHSKQESAHWAQQQYPGWSDLIACALERRREPDEAPRYPIHPDGPALLTFLGQEVLKRS